MQRRLEPQLMLKDYNVKAFAEADKTPTRKLFLKLLDEYFSPKIFNNVLDLCCGPAQYTIDLAEMLYCQIDAIDGSAPMLDIAKTNIEKSDLGHCIQLYNLHLPFITDKKYDLIVCVNSLHHFHDPKDFWITLKHHSTKGTNVLVIDLARPEINPSEVVEHYSSNESEYFQNDFYNSLHAAFTKEEVQGQLYKLSLDLNVEYQPSALNGFGMIIVWGEL
jgi:SAM-dependent methyltransferase